MTSPVLPDLTPIPELAEYLNVSERTARERAQVLGLYCKPGKPQGFVLTEDVPLILEDSKCRSNFFVGTKSGITGGQLPEGDYAALQAQRTRKSRKGSRRKQKPQNGEVISMDGGRT